MDEILSPEEIEALLGDLPQRKANPAGAAARLVQEYDLTRPSRMGHGQVERVSRLHGMIAGPLGERLSGALEHPVQVDLASLEQLRLDVFLRSLPDRTPVYGIGDTDSGITGLLAVDPTFLFGAIDRMLGGLGEAEPAARELTPTELALTEKILEPILRSLNEAWTEIKSLKFQVLSRPGEQRPGDDLDSESPVLAVTYLIGGSGPAGAIRYCLATPRLESLLASSGGRKLLGAPAGARDPRVERTLRAVKIPVSAILGHARVPVRDLAELEPGDVIPLLRGTHEPLEVTCGGQRKFEGYVGHRRGRYAVSISRRIARKPAEKNKPNKNRKKNAPAPKETNR
jgi:flagellar motor switch protein FliM